MLKPLATPVDAVRLHLIKCALVSLSGTLVWTAMMIYQVQVVGMTPLQLVMAGTTLEITIFLCEIPTGIVADVYSRRLSALIGFAIIGAAYLLQGLIPAFAAILFGHVLWGLGFTFTSGAYDAWLVDEVGQERAGAAFLRGSQVDRAAGIAGIILSVALGSLLLPAPIVLGGAVLVALAIVMVLVMPETGFKPMDRRQRTTWRHMADTFREGIAVIRRQPMLLRVLAIGFFFGLFSEGWDRLSQAHLITTFGLGSGNIPAIVIFGGLSILGMAAGIVLTEIVRRTLDTSRPRAVAGALFGFTLTMVICMIAFGLSPSLVVALIAFFVFGQARGQVEPIWQIFTNQHVESHVRATVLSFISQTDAIGQMAGGPPVGLIGNASLRAVFIVCSVLLMPTLYLLQRVRRSAPPGAIILEADAAP